MSLAVCITRSEVTPNEVVRYGRDTVAAGLRRMQQPGTETSAVIPLEPVGNRVGNRQENFLDEVLSICCLKASAHGDAENDGTINRRELVPGSLIFRVLNPQNKAGSG